MLPGKILVIRFSSIGDIVLTTPVVRALHMQLNAEVHFLTKPAFVSILATNPHIAKVITLSENLNNTLHVLKAEDYDYVVDLHHNLRSKRIKLALQKPSIAFHKLNFEKWLMVNLKINRLPEKHIVDRYIEAVAKLGVKNDQQGLDFFIPPEKEVALDTLGLIPMKYTAIVVGAAHATKCMVSAQIARLSELLAGPVVLLGGKQEWQKAEEIRTLSASTSIINVCGKFDIAQSGSLLRQAGTIISHDTGMMHIAAALQKPQVVVWGNTIPEFGMYPYYGLQNERSRKWFSFEIKGLPCRPCSKIGYEKCPKSHFRCMIDHDLQAIADTALKISRGEMPDDISRHQQSEY